MMKDAPKREEISKEEIAKEELLRFGKVKESLLGC